MAKTMADLKELPVWGFWYKDGPRKKIPHSPFGGYAKVNDPATWGTIKQAWLAKEGMNADGVSLFLHESLGITGVDLDHCIDDNGNLSDTASQIVCSLSPTVTMYSSSGKGLHLLVRGIIPSQIHTSGVEMYYGKKALALTLRPYNGAGWDIAERQDALLAWSAVFAPPVRLTKQRASYYETGNTEEIRRALSFIPPVGEYVDWLSVLMAVHSVLPNESGVALVEEWSPGTEGEVARKFESFNREGDGTITLATLFGAARRYGYTPEPRLAQVHEGVMRFRDK